MEGMPVRGLLRCAALALLALLAVLSTAAPATAARIVDVVLTEAEPAVVTLQAGDSVRFVNGEEGPLAPQHRVTSTTRDGSTEWSYDSGDIAPGATTEPVVFPAAGTYVFVDRRGGPGPLGADRLGRIEVAAAPPPPSSAPPAQDAASAPPSDGAAPPAQPAEPAQPAPPPPAAAAPPAPSGDGSAGFPGLIGTADPGALAQAPAEGLVPPAIAEAFPETTTTAPSAPTAPQVQALEGPLPGEGTNRALGLPAALAALAALGVGSLLVRVLLAEPAAQPGRAFAPVRLAPAE
jgi:plastocyanin